MTPWTIACQVPLSMGFSRQEYWSGLPFLSPGDLPDPGIELPAMQILLTEPPGKPKVKSKDDDGLKFLKKLLKNNKNLLISPVIRLVQK